QEQIQRDLRALQQSVQRLADAQQTVFERAARMERDATQIRLAFSLNDRERREIETLDSLLDFARVSAHIESVIHRAELVMEPFPHIVVDRMWPKEVYQLILRGIPPEPFFPDKDPIKQNIRVPIDFAPIFAARVWEFVDRVSRECIVPHVMKKFREPLTAHYDTLFGEAFRVRARRLPQSVSGGRLMLRRPGYHLDPHRDPKRAWLTCLMYLAKPGDSEAWGTQIFKVTGDQEAPYTQTYYPAESGAQVELAKLVPFVPNTALIFLNSGGAHGADIPRDAPADLERYSFQFYIGPDSGDLDALIRDLPPDRRARWVSKSAGSGM
ncbi:MAG: hypothetical protein AB7K63_20880, partial [Vicinamibacterales bacterium]